MGHGVYINQTKLWNDGARKQKFDSFVVFVKNCHELQPETAVALTFQFPDWMFIPERKRTPPIDIATNSDVGMFMAIRSECLKVAICVTVGAYHIGMFRFQRRTPTVVGCSSHSFGIVSNILPPEEIRYRGNTYVASPAHAPIIRTFGGIDDAMVFWEGLLG